MVRHAAIALLLLTGVARAQPPDPDDPDDYVESVASDDEPTFNMFGFRMSGGALPIDGDRAMALTLGLAVEHPVFKKTRVFGEYEWMWITVQELSERAMTSVVARPERRGTGHRSSFGLRRELIGKNGGSKLRLFIDGELGGSIALVNDNLHGTMFMPAAIAGLRLGYDMYSGSESSPSRTFEAELLMRAVMIDGGVGGMAGLGFFWGN